MEDQPLLGSTPNRDFIDRQANRSWFIGLFSVLIGLASVIAVVAQAALTSMTSQESFPETQKDHPFTDKVIFLFLFVGCCGVNTLAAGIFTMSKLGGKSGNNVETRYKWAAYDLHAQACAGLALASVSAVASLVAIIGFQSHDSDEPYAFNITGTTGWIIIGALVLFQLGVLSAFELDVRHIVGQFTSPQSKLRTIGTLQLCFAGSALVLSIGLFSIDTYKNALSIAAAIVSLITVILSFAAGGTILSHCNMKLDLDLPHLPKLDVAWGLAVAAHSFGLVSIGLFFYLGTNAIYSCYRNEDPKLYRPDCDSEIHFLAGIIPQLFSIIVMIMLGVTNLVAAIRVAKLVFDVTHKQDLSGSNVQSQQTVRSAPEIIDE